MLVRRRGQRSGYAAHPSPSRSQLYIDSGILLRVRQEGPTLCIGGHHRSRALLADRQVVS